MSTIKIILLLAALICAGIGTVNAWNTTINFRGAALAIWFLSLLIKD